MKENNEIDPLRIICEEAKSEGALSGKIKEDMKKVFGQRFLKAYETIIEERVKKYCFNPSGRVVWIVVGRNRDYLILPAAGFCSCDDFYYKVMKGEIYLCYHLIAQKLAESLGSYDQIEENDDFYEVLMNEWKKVTT